MKEAGWYVAIVMASIVVYFAIISAQESVTPMHEVIGSWFGLIIGGIAILEVLRRLTIWLYHLTSTNWPFKLMITTDPVWIEDRQRTHISTHILPKGHHNFRMSVEPYASCDFTLLQVRFQNISWKIFHRNANRDIVKVLNIRDGGLQYEPQLHETIRLGPVQPDNQGGQRARYEPSYHRDAGQRIWLIVEYDAAMDWEGAIGFSHSFRERWKSVHWKVKVE